jgi:hypothetical protein
MHEEAKKPYLGEKIAEAKDCVNTCAMRMSAQGLLADLTVRQQRRADALAILIKVIPWQLLSQRDEEMLLNSWTASPPF